MEEHIAKIRADIESKKTEHGSDKVEKHAEHAERDASFAIEYAFAAIEEAEYAVSTRPLRGWTPMNWRRRERAHKPCPKTSTSSRALPSL